MPSTFQAQIDAGLVEDPGECVHGWPAGSACPYCENDRIRSELLAVQKRLDELEAELDDELDELEILEMRDALYGD